MEMQTVKNRMQRGELRAIVDRMAARPDGVTNPELAAAIGVNTRKASSKARMIAGRGGLFAATRQCGLIHWFISAERAKAWGNSEPKLSAPVKMAGNLHSLSKGKKAGPPALTRYTAGASKFVSLKADAPVDARGAKFTKCPSGLDHRFVAVPAETEPLFKGMGIGRYLDAAA